MLNPLEYLGQGFLNRRWWFRRLYNQVMLALWRLGIGAIVSPFYLVLTTEGRKSGLPRHTVVNYQKVDGRTYILAIWGPRSNWYQNIVANPHVVAQTIGRPERAVATRVTDDQELRRVFDHLSLPLRPIAAWYLRSLGVEPTPEGIIAGKDRLYVLRLDPTEEPTPAPLQSNLTWVWPIIGALAAGLWLLQRSRETRRLPR